MFNILGDLNNLSALLTKRDKTKFLILLCLVLLASLLEAVAIGAIPAFVTLITKPSVLAKNRWVGGWFPDLPDTPSLSLILWASGILFVFVVFKTLFLTFVFYIQARIITSQRVKLGDRMFRTYQSAPYEWYLQKNSAELLKKIHVDPANIIGGILMPLINLMMALIMAAFVLAVMVLNMPGLAFLSLLVTGGGILLIIRILQSYFRRIGEVTDREFEKVIKAIQQGFGAFVEARITGCEGYLRSTHRNSLLRIAAAQRLQSSLQKATPYAVETIAIFGMLIILFLLIRSTDAIVTVLPVISLLGVAMIRLKQLASQIAAAVNDMNAARAFIPGIVRDVQELSIIEAKRQTKDSRFRIIDQFNVLSLSAVTYCYPNAGTQAVRDISIQIERGESVAFIGATGCGKSTLINLILGLLEPQAGKITVNNTDIYGDVGGWRKLLGYIPQSIYLIDDTIQANVAFGVPNDEVDNDRLWTALRSAGLEKFVMSQPYDLNSVVGERGVRLSGGQRQRLGIARALYPAPEVLVMDEATSALDNRTEEKVMQAIQNIKQNRTLIMVAHRLSTVEDCDRLYFMSKGRIEDVGTFEELRQSSAGFREMLRQSR